MVSFSIRQIFHAHLLFTGLDDVLSWLEQVEQRPSRAVPRLGDTSDRSGDESDVSGASSTVTFQEDVQDGGSLEG